MDSTRGDPSAGRIAIQRIGYFFGMPASRQKSAGPLRGAFHRDSMALLLISLTAYLVYGLERRLSRDNAIYYYSAQQWVQGIPPLVSFFDLKTPLTSFYSSLGVTLTPLIGLHELIVVRAFYIPIGLLTVLAIYQLAVDLWKSRFTGWIAALTLLSLEPLMYVTLSGPRPKVLSLFFVVTTLLAITRSRWLGAGALASLGMLAWQPAGLLIVTALIASIAYREGARAPLMVTVGAVIPVAMMAAYYATVGAMQEFLDASLLAHMMTPGLGEPPMVYLARMWSTAAARMGILFFPVMAGCLVFLVISIRMLLARSTGTRRALGPAVLCFALFFVFSLFDFQGIPDWLPLLPFACLGFARGCSELSRWLGEWRSEAGAVTRYACVGFCAVALFMTVTEPGHNNFRSQEARTKQILEDFDAGNSVVVIGATDFLAFSGVRSPTPHVLITPRGMAAYMDARIPGGTDGWLEQLRAIDPTIVVVRQSEGYLDPRVGDWIEAGREPHTYKRWTVWARP